MQYVSFLWIPHTWMYHTTDSRPIKKRHTRLSARANLIPSQCQTPSGTKWTKWFWEDLEIKLSPWANRGCLNKFGSECTLKKKIKKKQSKPEYLHQLFVLSTLNPGHRQNSKTENSRTIMAKLMWSNPVGIKLMWSPNKYIIPRTKFSFCFVSLWRFKFQIDKD